MTTLSILFASLALALPCKSWSAHLSIVVDYDKEYNPDYGQNEEQNSHDWHAVKIRFKKQKKKLVKL